jgi:mono/diheme cytochrome c family protein
VRFLYFILGVSGIFMLMHCQTTPYKDGAQLYKNLCANCHMDNGSGLNGLIPTLAAADYLSANRSKLPCILLYGLQDTIDITNILNYIGHHWGNELPEFQLEEVKKALEQCKDSAR